MESQFCSLKTRIRADKKKKKLILPNFKLLKSNIQVVFPAKAGISYQHCLSCEGRDLLKVQTGVKLVEKENGICWDQ
jgi:hypothetical protein